MENNENLTSEENNDNLTDNSDYTAAEEAAATAVLSADDNLLEDRCRARKAHKIATVFTAFEIYGFYGFGRRNTVCYHGRAVYLD